MPLKLTSETFPEVTKLDNLPIGKTDLKTVADVGPEPTAAVDKSSLKIIVAYSQHKSNNNIDGEQLLGIALGAHSRCYFFEKL